MLNENYLDYVFHICEIQVPVLVAGGGLGQEAAVLLAGQQVRQQCGTPRDKQKHNVAGAGAQDKPKKKLPPPTKENVASSVGPWSRSVAQKPLHSPP